MRSGIFAVATVGKYRIYVGESHQLQPRWAKMLALFVQGKFPSAKLQQAWQDFGEERRFTFHTAKQLSGDTTLYGYSQFLKDTGSDD